MTLLSCPQGRFHLSRYPIRSNEQLRAWDAADEFILNWLAENEVPLEDLQILILNDSFGALSVAMSNESSANLADKYTSGAEGLVPDGREKVIRSNKPVSVVDSFMSAQGMIHNFKENQLRIDAVERVFLGELPQALLEKSVDLVLIKVPKSLAQLEEQLHVVRPLIGDKTKVLAGGMVKSIHRSTLALFEQIIGPTKTSLAKKKARLIFAEKDESIFVSDNPFPKRYQLETDITGVPQKATLFAHGGVFSHAQLDIGSRLLLKSIPSDLGRAKILDLGCGNGVLGLIAAMRNPDSVIAFSDESHFAVESAKQSVHATLEGERLDDMEFHLTHCADGISEQSQDLVLNNPPFHAQGSRTDQISLNMFEGAHSVLKKGGEIRVVGNRHLGYHKRLKQIFGNCRVLDSNPKFVVLCAQK